jgi:hypothetical protein
MPPKPFCFPLPMFLAPLATLAEPGYAPSPVQTLIPIVGMAVAIAALIGAGAAGWWICGRVLPSAPKARIVARVAVVLTTLAVAIFVLPFVLVFLLFAAAGRTM